MGGWGLSLRGLFLTRVWKNHNTFISNVSLYDSVTILLPSAQNDRVNVDGIHETGPALAEAILVNNCLHSFHLDTVTKHQQLGSIVLWARPATWKCILRRRVRSPRPAFRVRESCPASARGALTGCGLQDFCIPALISKTVVL